MEFKKNEPRREKRGPLSIIMMVIMMMMMAVSCAYVYQIAKTFIPGTK